jgi:hypothetical protein
MEAVGHQAAAGNNHNDNHNHNNENNNVNAVDDALALVIPPPAAIVANRPPPPPILALRPPPAIINPPPPPPAAVANPPPAIIVNPPANAPPAAAAAAAAPDEHRWEPEFFIIDENEWYSIHGLAAEPRYGNESDDNQKRERERIQKEREYQRKVHSKFFREEQETTTKPAVKLQLEERAKNLKEWQDKVVELKATTDTEKEEEEDDGCRSSAPITSTAVISVNLAALARHSNFVYSLAVTRRFFRGDRQTSACCPYLTLSLMEYSEKSVRAFAAIFTRQEPQEPRDDSFLDHEDAPYSIQDLPPDCVVDCCRLASYFQCPALQNQIVSDILIPSVDSENCMCLCQLADQLGIPTLLEASLNHIMRSLDRVQQPKDGDDHDFDLWNEYLTPELQAKIIDIQNVLRSNHRKQIFFSSFQEYLAMLAEQYQYYRERLEEAYEQQQQQQQRQYSNRGGATLTTPEWRYAHSKILLQKDRVERLGQFLQEQKRLFGGKAMSTVAAAAADVATDDDDGDTNTNTDNHLDNNNEDGNNDRDDNDSNDRQSEGESPPPRHRGKKQRSSPSSRMLLLAGILVCLCRTLAGAPFLHTAAKPFGLIQFQSNRLLALSEIVRLHGGALDGYGDADEYDDECEDDEDLEEDKEEDDLQPRHPVPRPNRKPQGSYDHSIIDLPPDSIRGPGPLKSGRPLPSSRPRPLRKKKKQPHWSQRLATSSLQMTGKVAWNTLVKQPSKLAYHVIRPKYVDIRETEGLWRLEQQVTERGGREVASVATIELQSRPRLVILRKEEHPPKNDKPAVITIKEPYTFTKKKLTGSFQTQFVAPAFLIGENQMRLYGYRGIWQRKLADKRVIKLVGKIYQVHKQRFGKQRGEYVFGQAVGTFVARRRIKARIEEEEDGDDFDEMEEYDDEDAEEEWDEVDEEWEEEED